MKCGRVVVQSVYSKAPRLSDGLEELVNLHFEHPPSELGAITGPLDESIEIIYRIYTSLV